MWISATSHVTIVSMQIVFLGMQSYLCQSAVNNKQGQMIDIGGKSENIDNQHLPDLAIMLKGLTDKYRCDSTN